MRVCLHERERDPLCPGGQRDRAGHVAAPSEHDVGPSPAHDPDARRHRRRGAGERPHELPAGPAREPFHPERLERESGRGHERRLGPLGAREHDLGAPSPKRLGDGERRQDVPGCPAGGDQAYGLALRLRHG